MALEAIVDGRAHFVARLVVGRVVVDPEPGLVGDRGVGESQQEDLGRGRRQHPRRVPERLHHRGLHLIGRHQIRGAHFDLEADRRRGLRVVDDWVLGDDVVREDDEVPRLRAQLGGTPGDLGDAAFVATDLDPVPDVERLLALDGEAREGVAQGVLEREAEDDGADRRGRHELLAEEGRREQDQPDDNCVLEDGREPVRDAIDAQRIDDEEDGGVDQRGGERERANADTWVRAATEMRWP